jgi:DNA polymerase III epsilon subunit-like protein
MSRLGASWCDGPIVALDLETTDVDPHRDRIVTASVVTISPRPGERPEVSCRTWLADPGVEIPADATAIHGVSTEQACRDGRPPAEVVMEVAEHLGEHWTPSVPLCVFNAAFDLTMLDAELRRYHGRSLPLSAFRHTLAGRACPTRPGQATRKLPCARSGSTPIRQPIPLHCARRSRNTTDDHRSRSVLGSSDSVATPNCPARPATSNAPPS